MSISHLIDTVCAYLNSVTSFFSTLQRLKNEFHASDIDYSSVVLQLLRQPRSNPADLGSGSDPVDGYEKVLLSALVSLAVYGTSATSDWTSQLSPILRSRCRITYQDPWRRGRLRPVTIDLLESHYMRTSKAQVFMATYKPLKFVVLSLPGTNSKSDWLSNLHSANVDLEVDGALVKVHQGFLYIAKCLSTHQVIRKYLNDAIDAGFSDVLLCGHSQAGAVVSLLSILLESDFELNTKVVTFGSGASFQRSNVRADSCTSFVRCVKTGEGGASSWQVDPVPLLDDAILSEEKSLAMFPAGQIYTLLDHQSICEVRSVTANELRSLLSGVLLNFSADPHAMKGYVRCILMLAPPKSDCDESIEDDFLAILGLEECDDMDDEVTEDEQQGMQVEEQVSRSTRKRRRDD